MFEDNVGDSCCGLEHVARARVVLCCPARVNYAVRKTFGFPRTQVRRKKRTPHALPVRGGALWQDNLAPSTAASPAKDVDGQRIGATYEAGRLICIASLGIAQKLQGLQGQGGSR